MDRSYSKTSRYVCECDGGKMQGKRKQDKLKQEARLQKLLKRCAEDSGESETGIAVTHKKKRKKIKKKLLSKQMHLNVSIR